MRVHVGRRRLPISRARPLPGNPSFAGVPRRPPAAAAWNSCLSALAWTRRRRPHGTPPGEQQLVFCPEVKDDPSWDQRWGVDKGRGKIVVHMVLEKQKQK